MPTRFAANVLPVIQQIKASGMSSLRAIAKALNARGIATARGGVWTPVQVTAVLRRASAQVGTLTAKGGLAAR
jgi:Recombinase